MHHFDKTGYIMDIPVFVLGQGKDDLWVFEESVEKSGIFNV